MLDACPILGRKGPASPPADHPAQPVPDRLADPENETTTGGAGRWLCCRFCGLKITSPSTQTSPNGRHRHTFANPHGYVFDVRCFASAPGAVPVGVFSAEFTWFAGHRWKVALCRRCQVHLGWVFQGSADRFYALIGDRLRETSD
jgi:hypothetical protein